MRDVNGRKMETNTALRRIENYTASLVRYGGNPRYIGPAGVIASMSYGALAAIAGSSIGSTVNYSLYRFSSLYYNNIKIDWSLYTSNGETYGGYTSIIPV